jgi:NhaA family Na+:H+ antiporter
VGDRQDSAKLGILLGSFCAAILGTIYMSIVSKSSEHPGVSGETQEK